jgi:hypothetical protein
MPDDATTRRAPVAHLPSGCVAPGLNDEIHGKLDSFGCKS